MLAWMDLEMTGLDPVRHVIIEIATIITDDNLEIVAESPDLVVHATEEQLTEMDAVVTEMHTSSGLVDAVRASTVSIEDAGRQTLEFLTQHIPERGRVPLCGNSIAMDRRFLDHHLPEIEHFFHYRSIDVTTLKELSKRWHPTVYGGAPKKAGHHRALDDVRESIAELAYYRDSFLRLPQKSE